MSHLLPSATERIRARGALHRGADSAELARQLRAYDLFDHAAAIARCWHLTLRDMFHSRQPPAPYAREAFYCYLRDLGWSYPGIGAFVGRDHSTILAACRERS